MFQVDVLYEEKVEEELTRQKKLIGRIKKQPSGVIPGVNLEVSSDFLS